MNEVERWYEFVATKIFDRLRSPLLLVLRAYIGWQFFVTGRGKLQNIERVTAFFDSLGIPAPGLNAWFVGSLECVGGLLLLAGLCSRPVALLLAGNMAVAYLTADRDVVVNIFDDPESFTAAEPFLYLLVSLLVLAFGPGAVSVDRAIRKWRGASAGRGALAPAVLLLLLGAVPAPQYAEATFAGGCFWSFETLPGVISVIRLHGKAQE
ncbi:MAG TPA: DoxX family membrane protein [Thermoanaerobaculia bacterium]|nr:DoxX family membrane protein [Thermoanaerobaculia bacterium]